MPASSLYRRVLFVVLAVLLACAGLILHQTLAKDEHRLLAEIDGRENKVLDLAVWMLADKAPFAKPEDAKARIEDLGGRLGHRVTYVLAPVGTPATGDGAPGGFGTVFADSQFPGEAVKALANHGDRPEIRQALAEDTGRSHRRSSSVREDLIYLARRVTGVPGLPDGVLRVSLPYAAVHASLADNRTRTLALAGVMVALAGGLSLLMARRLSKSVTDFGLTLRERSREEVPKPLRVPSHAEFAPFVETFDNLCGRLRGQLRELRDVRALSEVLLAQGGAAVAILDERLYIKEANDGFQALLDQSIRPVGRHALEAGLPVDLVTHAENLLKLDESSQVAMRAALPKGREADAVMLSFAGAGGHQRVLVALRDVEPMQKAQAVLRDFRIQAAHRLRTPLTGVLGFAETLLDTRELESDPARDMLKVIVTRAREIDSVLTELLNDCQGQESPAQSRPSAKPGGPDNGRET